MKTSVIQTARLKQLLIATTATLILGSSVASAGHGDRKCDGPRHGFTGEKVDHKAMFKRRYDKQQIRVLAHARLIMQGNENLKIGKIKVTKTGFTVSIMTKDDSLVRKWKLAPNGMPLERYEHIKARMQEHG